jgi:hypothetical protein
MLMDEPGQHRKGLTGDSPYAELFKRLGGMPRAWISTILARIRSLARSRNLAFTLKTSRELAELGLDEEDACDILSSSRQMNVMGESNQSIWATGCMFSNRRS